LACTAKNSGTTANSFDSVTITTGSGTGSDLGTTISVGTVISGITYSTTKALTANNFADL